MVLQLLPVKNASAALPSHDRVRILQSAREISDIELVDHNGRPFALGELQGRVVLMFFGFTNCPDVCPIALQNLRQLAEAGEPKLKDIAYVMVSVDGERDSPEVLKSYLAKYSPGFIGLTGERTKVKAIATEFSAAFFRGSGDNYSVSHSPQIFVVDPAGRLRAEFYNASTEAMADVTLALLKEAEASD
jgi:protein SCO1/2